MAVPGLAKADLPWVRSHEWSSSKAGGSRHAVEDERTSSGQHASTASIGKILRDQPDESCNSRPCIRAACLELDNTVACRTHRHHLRDALGVDPVGGASDAHCDLRLEALGE